MTRQYLREAKLKIAGKEFNTRIAFEIKKGEKEKESTGTESNKSTVSVYNLSESSRGLIENESGKGKMQLEAGYKNNLSTIFIGDVASVEMKRNGADIETKIEAGDGEYQLTNAHINISLGVGATDYQIIDEAIKTLGLSRGLITGLPTTARSNGFAYSGLASDLLSQIAKKNDMIWSIQNSAVQMRPAGDLTGRTAILLTDKTGLIGIPNKTEKGFKAECLLNYELEPGKLVIIRSALLTNDVTYNISGVEHVGDTHGDKWMTTILGSKA